MRPRSSAAITPSTMDSTSAARLRLLPPQLLEAVGELAVHLPERLHQRVDVGDARAGEAGRGARGDRPGRGGDAR